MTDTTDISGYGYANAELNDSHGYLLPALRAELGRLTCEKRLFDLGCGNGSIGAAVHGDGWDVTGCDVSAEGIAQEQARHPHLTLRTHAVLAAGTGWHRDRIVPLSRLLEESGAGADRQDGRAFPRAVGPWPHQVLVDPDADHAADRGRLRDAAFRTGGAGAAAGQIDDRHRPQARLTGP